MADIFDVIADPTRREILRVLLDRHSDDGHPAGEISVSEIVATLAEEFRADAALLRVEVLGFVQGLLDRGLLQAAP